MYMRRARIAHWVSLSTVSISRIICLDPTRVVREVRVIIDHVEKKKQKTKNGDLIGRDKILSPAQLRVRDATRPFQGLASQTNNHRLFGGNSIGLKVNWY